MKKKPNDDEIDITKLILNLWKNKIEIVVITTIFLILGFLYFNSFEKKLYASTNIKPISTFENEKYKIYNRLAERVLEDKTLEDKTSNQNIYKFNQETFLSLFVSKIQTEDLLEKGIIKFQLVNKDKFINEEDYKEEIKKTAISIIDQMIPLLDDEKNKNKNKNFLYWKFNFQINDKQNWINFLKYLEKQTNEEIRLSLLNSFNIEMEILNLDLKHQLEDIEKKILNELDDYKNLITNRVEFLKEQAEIARTLNIAKNTLVTEGFQADIAIITNKSSEDSYYLRGYEMIEKEISLINSRENEKAFIPNLYELEKNKRLILQDKRVERLKVVFSETPINDKNYFQAAKIDYVATDFETKRPLSLILIIFLLAGFLISLIYIYLNNILAFRK